MHLRGAGRYAQALCAHANGSGAPVDAFVTQTAGLSGVARLGSCPAGPGSHGLAAQVGASVASGSDTSAAWVYKTPPGTLVVGGTISVTLHTSTAGTSTAANVDSAGPQHYDRLAATCNVPGAPTPCQATVGPVQLTVGSPAAPTSAFGIAAICGAMGCAAGQSAQAYLDSGEVLLSNFTQPAAASFSGGLLAADANGTAGLLFTASDLGGPGVFQVTALVDGRLVYRATPNTDGGRCVPAGTEPASGALIFDYQQPCPTSTAVDLSVATARLRNGRHRLQVLVTDAARNTTPVLDTTITTVNSTTTPLPRHRRSVRARFVVSWALHGARTVLRGVTVRHLPAGARVAVRCFGPHCPRLTAMRARAAQVSRLLANLRGKTLHAGDRLVFTVTAPHRRPERVEVVFRAAAPPRGRSL